MRDLPSGTVTLLFTDIEDSTRLLDELWERYADVLAEHRRLLCGAFSRHGAVEVDTQGDAFFVAFARAAERGESERAGRLWGAIEDQDSGAPLGGWRRHRELCGARILDCAGPEFDRGRAEGRTLTLDDAVSIALDSQ